MTDTPAKTTIKSSPYTVYSGVAAEDLEKTSVILKIICPELLPNTAYGTVAAGITENNISLQDRDGKPLSSQATTANHLVATWEGASNQRYAPLVRKGEAVEVFKSSGQDKFLWRLSGRGRDFRTTDRVHFEIGATDPSKPGVEKNDTNTYSMWMDSDNQTAGFKSSKANGEVAAFSASFDMKNGTFHISDDSEDPGNRLFLDVGKEGSPVFQINLVSGLTFKMEGENLFVKVPGMFQIDVMKRFVINSPIMVFNLEKTGTFIINAANVAINTAKDLVVTAGGILGLNAASTKVSGVLIAAALRAAQAVKGPVGGNYSPVEIRRPQEDEPTDSSNVSDTDTSGLPYKTT